jgi:hypothetical protein
MELLHNGRKIISGARRIGNSWILETTIWPPSSDEADDPKLIQTIGVASDSEDEAHAKAITIGKRLIDTNCI